MTNGVSAKNAHTEYKPMTVGDLKRKLNEYPDDMPVFRWGDSFYAPICSIDQVSFDSWAEEQDEEDLEYEMSEQGLEKQNFPFVAILFDD